MVRLLRRSTRPAVPNRRPQPRELRLLVWTQRLGHVCVHVEGQPNTSETRQVSPVSDLFGKRGSQNRGCEINNSVGAENDTRASLSWDGTMMVFGSTYRQLRAAVATTRISSREEGESQSRRFQ